MLCQYFELGWQRITKQKNSGEGLERGVGRGCADNFFRTPNFFHATQFCSEKSVTQWARRYLVSRVESWWAPLSFNKSFWASESPSKLFVSPNIFAKLLFHTEHWAPISPVNFRWVLMSCSEPFWASVSPFWDLKMLANFCSEKIEPQWASQFFVSPSEP